MEPTQQNKELVTNPNATLLALFFILLSIYLSIYSNIFSSVILAVTCGSVLFVNLFVSRYKFIETIKAYPLHVLVLMMWVVSAIFESNGGRAERMGKSSLDISGAVDSALSLLSQMNGTFITVFVVGFAACIFGFLASGKFKIQEKKIVLICLISSILIFNFFIIRCCFFNIWEFLMFITI